MAKTAGGMVATLSTALSRPISVDAWSKILNTEGAELQEAIRTDGKVLDFSTNESDNPYGLTQPKNSNTAKKALKLKQDKIVSFVNPDDVSFWPAWRGHDTEPPESEFQQQRNFVWDVFEKPEHSRISNYINL